MRLTRKAFLAALYAGITTTTFLSWNTGPLLLAERTAPDGDLVVEIERRRAEALCALGRLGEAEAAVMSATATVLPRIATTIAAAAPKGAGRPLNRRRAGVRKPPNFMSESLTRPPIRAAPARARRLAFVFEAELHLDPVFDDLAAFHAGG